MSSAIANFLTNHCRFTFGRRYCFYSKRMTSIGYTEIGKYVDTHGNEYENAQLCIDISEYLLETRKGNFQIQLEGMKTTAAAD